MRTLTRKQLPGWLVTVLKQCVNAAMLQEAVTLKTLGSGANRTAYRLLDTPYVVKEARHLSDHCWPKPRRTRIGCAPTVRVGDWDVQYYYPPLTRQQYSHLSGHRTLDTPHADLDNPGNLGLDADGTVVAFDW